MFSKRSHKENAELTERFSISENVRLIQDLPGVHRLVKLTMNEGFLAVEIIILEETGNTWKFIRVGCLTLRMSTSEIHLNSLYCIKT